MSTPSQPYTYTKTATATNLRTVAASALRSLRTKVDTQIDTWSKIRSLQGPESAFAAVTPSEERGWNLDEKAVEAIDGTVDRILALPSQLGYQVGQESYFRCDSRILPRRKAYEYGIELRLSVVPNDGVSPRGSSRTSIEKLTTIQTLNAEQCPSKSIQTWIKPGHGNEKWCYEILEEGEFGAEGNE